MSKFILEPFVPGVNSKQKTPMKDADWSTAFGKPAAPLPGIHAGGQKVVGGKPTGYVPSFTMGSAKKQASELVWIFSVFSVLSRHTM